MEGNGIIMTTQSFKSIKSDALTEVLSSTLENITSPKISGIVYPGDDTAASVNGGQTITVNGSGFQTGAVVYVDGTVVGITSVVNDMTLTFISPAKIAGSYNFYIVNTDGGTAIFIPGIQYSGVPEWSTPAGSLGSLFEAQNINYTLSATSDSTVSYSIATGSLVSGGSLNSSTGAITGTAGLVNDSTTYSFGVDAIDQELQDTRRNFSITVNPDVVTWTSPANNTSYSNTVGDVFSLTLTATSIASNPITYTANVLPNGLSISGSDITGTFNAEGNSSSLITATASNTNKFATRVLNWLIASAPIGQPYGWFGGGYSSVPPGGIRSIVDRVDYNNDTVVASVRGPLSISSERMAATGNGDFGWFAMGRAFAVSVSRIERINYNNDTATSTSRGLLSLPRYGLAATGNTDFGWFCGGYLTTIPSTPSTGIKSTVDRITYSNDNNTASLRGPLSGTKYNIAAASNQSFGWIGGGGTTDIERINFASDTGVAAIRGSFSLRRTYLGGTGNSDFGWFGCGLGSTPGGFSNIISTVERIDYANDLAMATTRGSLSFTSTSLAATGSQNFGWFGGGSGPSFFSLVSRIQYSNDTVTASNRGVLNLSRSGLAATGGFPG
jgi:hypothetical protein